MHLPVNTLLQGGKYKIIRFINSGGFGCTYEAEHTLFNTHVAIKEFFKEDLCNRDERTNRVSVGVQSKAETVARLKKKFMEEAAAIFKMSHPGIVRVIDIFEENGTAYYVMDFIDGCSLSDIVRRCGKLPEKDALHYILQVIDALQYVHSRNRLHLDIKPGNIMVDKQDRAILIDFGASKHYNEDSGKQDSTLLGVNTPGYTPVEQVAKKFSKFNPATDIYALGATLYKLLTGITPMESILRADEDDENEIFDDLPPMLSASTREAIMAAMQIKSINRPQSLEEFKKMLCGDIDNEEKTVYDDLVDTTVIDGDNNGISIFSFTNDSLFSIYYQGQIYDGCAVDTNKLNSLAEIESMFNNVRTALLTKKSYSTDFETYIRDNGVSLHDTFNIITLRNENDFLKIQQMISGNPSVFGKYRIEQEIQLIPLCFDSHNDSKLVYEYQKQYCEVDSGGGVVEILRSGFTDDQCGYTPHNTVKKFSDSEGFVYLALGAVIQYRIIYKKAFDDVVLLSCMPFDIAVEIWIDGRYRDGIKLIDCNPCIPMKKTETITDDKCNVIILFLGKRFLLNIYELFHYYPSSFDIMVTINVSYQIMFILKDNGTKKEIPISLSMLLNMEETNIMYNE